MNDNKLWDTFSFYIRLRDSNEEGYAKCITCTLIKYWTEMDAGHGIGRQHKSVKYHEKNVHSQSRNCNNWGQGETAIYKTEVDRRYGSGTWDLLELAKKQQCKRSQFDIDAMEEHYFRKACKLIETKSDKCKQDCINWLGKNGYKKRWNALKAK